MARNCNRLFVILALLAGLWNPSFRPTRPATVTMRDEAEVASTE